MKKKTFVIIFDLICCFGFMLGCSSQTYAAVKCEDLDGNGKPDFVLFPGIVSWYNGLTCNDGGHVIWPNAAGDNQSLKEYIQKIIFNVITDISLVIGIIAVGFLIVAGYKYVMSAGDPNKIASANKSISSALAGLVIGLSSFAIVNFVSNVFIGDANISEGAFNLPDRNFSDILADSLNMAYAVVGVIAVIYVIICGIQMVTSNGDPAKVAKARKGIIYSAIGIVITLLAAAITNFVLGKIS